MDLATKDTILRACLGEVTSDRMFLCVQSLPGRVILQNIMSFLSLGLPGLIIGGALDPMFCLLQVVCSISVMWSLMLCNVPVTLLVIRSFEFWFVLCNGLFMCLCFGDLMGWTWPAVVVTACFSVCFPFLCLVDAWHASIRRIRLPLYICGVLAAMAYIFCVICGFLLGATQDRMLSLSFTTVGVSRSVELRVSVFAAMRTFTVLVFFLKNVYCMIRVPKQMVLVAAAVSRYHSHRGCSTSLVAVAIQP
jgi:hypothetical protein